jgi:hypothetical protein
MNFDAARDIFSAAAVRWCSRKNPSVSSFKPKTMGIALF